MKRAAIIIGVHRSGNLPLLQDATAGAKRMAQWACQQGFDTTLITDAGERSVDVRRIRSAVGACVKAGTYEQLLVYFAGHGVNIRYCEYWLLSDAPEDPQAAVNVMGSTILARYCGIPHVVFISDACRTAAEGLQAQFITGSEIFPNDGSAGLEQPVDQFFACALGRPAYEVREAAAASRQFKAIYTHALIDALGGELSDAITWETPADRAAVAYIRPRDLKRAVAAEVVLRIQSQRLLAAIVQTPDAHICSAPDAWIARYDNLPPARYRSGQAPAAPDSTPRLRGLLSKALADSGSVAAALEAKKELAGLWISRLVEPSALPVPRTNSIRVHGATLRSVHTRAAAEGNGDGVLLHGLRDRGHVALAFSNQTCAMLPALPGYDTTLTFAQGELASVVFEPDWGAPAWLSHYEQAADLALLRTIAERAAQDGAFRPDRMALELLTNRIRLSRSIEPALSLYAAYACDEQHLHDAVTLLANCQHTDLGGPLFDLAMLAASPGHPLAYGAVLMPFPLLAQGWARLPLLAGGVPPALQQLQHHLVPSLWTLFDDSAYDQLTAAIDHGGLQ